MDDPECDRLVIAVQRCAGVSVVHVWGEVERDNADELRRTVVEAASVAGVVRVEVDVSAVPFVDAAALTALERAADAAPADVDLLVTGAQPVVRRVLAFSYLGGTYRR